ncbi:MAG: ABC transporter substrate-binding protein [Bdellovibrio bacteriovorus]
MKRRRRTALGVVVLTACWGLSMLSACSQPHPPLRVATIPWIGYQPLFLAEDLGYYPRDTIRLVELSSNTESLRALRNRDVEAAALTLDEALLLAAEGHDIPVILVLDCSAGADALVARSGVDALSDLAGRRVGVESSANGAYVLSRALQLAGLTPTDIHVVPLRSGDQLDAFRAGRVDALVTYEPLRTQLAAFGAETLFDSREIPCEIVDVLAVHRDMLAERQAQIERLLQGWFAAVDHHAKVPSDAAERLASRLGMEPEHYLAAIAGVELGTPAINCRALHPPAGESGLAAGALGLAGIMKANGLLRGDPDLARFVESGPVRALGCADATRLK